MSDRHQTDVAVAPGDVLAGKYRVERVLGEGGMGVVVAAHHIELDEKVALKFLHPQRLDDESRARFLREARAAVKIKSEHVARVTDVGQLEDGSPYLVMEYLEGRDLEAWLREGPLPVEQAVDFVLQTCEAIADAHVLGIVHRDLKPANLFCIQRTDGELSIKVLDFGISKMTTPGAPGHDMTSTLVLMGSPHYMSPEQMQRSKGVDARTDIWSLGVILFELLTGRPPFTADAVTELAIMVANDPTPSLRALRPDAPEGLERVVATCLMKDRTRRFQTVGELALALKDYGSPRSRLSVERVLGTLRQASGPVQPPSRDSRTVVPVVSLSESSATGSRPQTLATWDTVAVSRSRHWALLGVAAGLVALGVVGLVVLRHSAPPLAVPDLPAASLLPSSTEVVAHPDTSAAPPSPTTSVPSAVVSAAIPAPSNTVPRAATQALSPQPVRPAGPAPAPTHPPVVAPAAAPATPPKPSCNPPYFVDAAGLRHYKPECL